jgi:23S rRNA (uracil1939-C5)-methyltransferase
MKQPKFETVYLDKVVGGGQTLGQFQDGKKVFVWGGVPGEKVTVRLTKSKSKFAEGIVTEVHEPSPQRIEARDPESYLSTSPWQIYSFEAEQHYKAALIEEAFELHDIVLPDPITIKTDSKQYEYRNKVEFSFWWNSERNQLDLAFFRRGGHSKVAVDGTSLAMPAITEAAQKILELLRAHKIEGRNLKTLLIRTSQDGRVSAQLYIKDKDAAKKLPEADLKALKLAGIELIYSDHRSPASVITEKILSVGDSTLTDTILDIPFYYATESFFQVNIPLYAMALTDMRKFIPTNKPVIDMYSGVGSIGLTIGGGSPTLVEVNDAAVQEMRRNTKQLGRHATIVHASSETALEHISSDATIIVDPPRAGLHEKVVLELIEKAPQRIIYLSCNPVTQARDIAYLAAGNYGIRAHIGYNFFPRTPHIEHLVILDKKAPHKLACHNTTITKLSRYSPIIEAISIELLNNTIPNLLNLYKSRVIRSKCFIERGIFGT